MFFSRTVQRITKFLSGTNILPRCFADSWNQKKKESILTWQLELSILFFLCCNKSHSNPSFVALGDGTSPCFWSILRTLCNENIRRVILNFATNAFSLELFSHTLVPEVLLDFSPLRGSGSLIWCGEKSRKTSGARVIFTSHLTVKLNECLRKSTIKTRARKPWGREASFAPFTRFPPRLFSSRT